MSDVLERTDEKVVTTNDGDHDKFQHYFTKAAIDKNLMYGKAMLALCGKIVEQQVDPKGRAVCGTCQELLDEYYPA